ncbi:hypothetical protein IA829_13875 [Listeria seeligeri]|uniref:hypothetical protein n=1 Tax=Listeria seeligeri TaxID=1640 RepID=UPI0018882A69|nr:hypothetical protein [Listeria seeligeri]MBF2477009.1 hypothetical protein [Listeria seeligeri]MBF2631634.1 hypothetical protein [Listeria seeligeri]
MLNNDMKIESQKLIDLIEEFWKDNVSSPIVEIPENTPFGIFRIECVLYDKYNIRMSYERSTLGISILNSNTGEYEILSKVAKEPIFRGLSSYKYENLLYNFQVLDNTLKNI